MFDNADDLSFIQMVVTEEIKNLRRLEAQRNELNAKGGFVFLLLLRGRGKYYRLNHILSKIFGTLVCRSLIHLF